MVLLATVAISNAQCGRGHDDADDTLCWPESYCCAYECCDGAGEFCAFCDSSTSPINCNGAGNSEGTCVTSTIPQSGFVATCPYNNSVPSVDPVSGALQCLCVPGYSGAACSEFVQVILVVVRIGA